MDPVLFNTVPLAMYLALLAAVVLAAATGPREAAPARPFAAAVALLPFVFPSPYLWSQILVAPIRVGPIVIALIAAVLLYRAQESAGTRLHSWPLAGMAFLLLAAGEWGDPYIEVLALAPIAIVSCVRALMSLNTRESRIQHALPFVAVTAAWLGVHAVLAWTRYRGTLSITAFAPATIPYSRFGDSLSNWLRALLLEEGAFLFDRLIDVRLVPAVLRAAYLLAACLAAWLALRDEAREVSRGRAQGDWLTAVLAVSAALMFAENVLGAADLNLRHRIPLLVVLSVVLARRFAIRNASWIERRKPLAIALGLILVYLYKGPVGQYLP